MSALPGYCRRTAGCFILAASMAVAQARADTVRINLDEAQIFPLPDRVATIVIGNPLIADATLQNGGILVVTGKGYGATNLMALDRAGRVLMETTVQVIGPGTKDLVVVYRGVQQESYSCAPTCQRRITLGDSVDYFNSTMGQTSTRSGQAQTTSPPR
ncbi:MAG TPA: pilus assembly protein N-terminal domain-containing protein [Pseudolabrys sp.]|nr:pilus assembly protein N-terminal domain-containing protein [Pseudolabrys sp.]